MSEQMQKEKEVTDSEIEEYFEELERDLKRKNDEVRSRQYCLVCSRSVDDGDYDYKYMAAGGVLAGPFCGRECHFEYLLEDDETTENISEAEEGGQR